MSLETKPEPLSETGNFVQLMLESQSRLYAFILSLVCHPEQAAEVLQETNLVLWKKSSQFEPGTNFMAWAFRIARFQVMALRQRQSRDRHVFDQTTVNQVADAFESQADDFDTRLAMLAHCLNELPDEGRGLIRQRYEDGWSVKRLAEQLGQGANRVAVRLFRLRRVLIECIRKKQFEESST